jgi:RNA polymerase sigma-54 factor
MMRMDNRLVQNQSQRLMLTQKMQQALQILQYNALELETHIQQELDANPVLELLPPDPAPEPIPAAPPTTTGHDAQDYNDREFNQEEFVSPWEERIKEGRDLSINPETAARRDFYENSITKADSLSAHLLMQLRMTFGDNDRQYAVGERLIGDIDDRGYFTGSVEEIAAELGQPAAEVERVLYAIQKFEPSGVGARDTVECLLLQINAEYPDDTELRTLVQDHLDALQHRQVPKIARAMGITPERVEELRRKLSTLDPYPGMQYESAPTQYIAPDLVVLKADGEWQVQLTAESGPALQLNPEYRDLAKDKQIPRDDKAFLREKLEAAKWLIRNIEQRRQTILKVGAAIIDFQREFLEKGPDAIRPLTLQEIADVVGVHEATVSRTTRGKYIQTPQGLFELKYFFSPGLKSANGEDQSSKSVQLHVKRIVNGEDKRHPLSDQKIADILKKDGLTIARRTVTKYREALGIPATNLRKEY